MSVDPGMFGYKVPQNITATILDNIRNGEFSATAFNDFDAEMHYFVAGISVEELDELGYSSVNDLSILKSMSDSNAITFISLPEDSKNIGVFVTDELINTLSLSPEFSNLYKTNWTIFEIMEPDSQVPDEGYFRPVKINGGRLKKSLDGLQDWFDKVFHQEIKIDLFEEDDLGDDVEDATTLQKLNDLTRTDDSIALGSFADAVTGKPKDNLDALLDEAYDEEDDDEDDELEEPVAEKVNDDDFDDSEPEIKPEPTPAPVENKLNKKPIKQMPKSLSKHNVNNLYSKATVTDGADYVFDENSSLDETFGGDLHNGDNRDGVGRMTLNLDADLGDYHEPTVDELKNAEFDSEDDMFITEKLDSEAYDKLGADSLVNNGNFDYDSEAKDILESGEVSDEDLPSSNSVDDATDIIGDHVDLEKEQQKSEDEYIETYRGYGNEYVPDKTSSNPYISDEDEDDAADYVPLDNNDDLSVEQISEEEAEEQQREIDDLKESHAHNTSDEVDQDVPIIDVNSVVDGSDSDLESTVDDIYSQNESYYSDEDSGDVPHTPTLHFDVYHEYDILADGEEPRSFYTYESDKEVIPIEVMIRDIVGGNDDFETAYEYMATSKEVDDVFRQVTVKYDDLYALSNGSRKKVISAVNEQRKRTLSAIYDQVYYNISTLEKDLDDDSDFVADARMKYIEEPSAQINKELNDEYEENVQRVNDEFNERFEKWYNEVMSSPQEYFAKNIDNDTRDVQIQELEEKRNKDLNAAFDNYRKLYDDWKSAYLSNRRNETFASIKGLVSQTLFGSQQVVYSALSQAQSTDARLIESRHMREELQKLRQQVEETKQVSKQSREEMQQTFKAQQEKMKEAQEEAEQARKAKQKRDAEEEAKRKIEMEKAEEEAKKQAEERAKKEAEDAEKEELKRKEAAEKAEQEAQEQARIRKEEEEKQRAEEEAQRLEQERLDNERRLEEERKKALSIPELSDDTDDDDEIFEDYPQSENNISDTVDLTNITYDDEEDEDDDDDDDDDLYGDEIPEELEDEESSYQNNSQYGVAVQEDDEQELDIFGNPIQSSHVPARQVSNYDEDDDEPIDDYPDDEYSDDEYDDYPEDEEYDDDDSFDDEAGTPKKRGIGGLFGGLSKKPKKEKESKRERGSTRFSKRRK